MPRLRLQDFVESRLPEVIGVCADNYPAIAAAVNAAQERLVYSKESGDEGFLGSFAEVVFNVLQSDPYIALDRYGGRLMAVDVCRKPVVVNNQFQEYLIFGNGRQPTFDCSGNVRPTCSWGQVYDRGSFPTYRDMTKGHLIRVRALDPLDQSTGKRTLIQGTDMADHTIYSQDGTIRVQGDYLTLVAPFVDSYQFYNSLTGIQKDVTNGAVTYWDVDPITAAETLILTMEPGETVAGYRRYYLSGLPTHCCPIVLDASGNQTVQIWGLVKLNLVPVVVPTDYLLLQSREAVINECQSIRWSTMDIPNAMAMSAKAHRDAIGILNGQLTHAYGTNNPAISFFPFGSAKLEHQKIGTMV